MPLWQQAGCGAEPRPVGHPQGAGVGTTERRMGFAVASPAEILPVRAMKQCWSPLHLLLQVGEHGLGLGTAETPEQ